MFKDSTVFNHYILYYTIHFYSYKAKPTALTIIRFDRTI